VRGRTAAPADSADWSSGRHLTRIESPSADRLRATRSSAPTRGIRLTQARAARGERVGAMEVRDNRVESSRVESTATRRSTRRTETDTDTELGPIVSPLHCRSLRTHRRRRARQAAAAGGTVCGHQLRLPNGLDHPLLRPLTHGRRYSGVQSFPDRRLMSKDATVATSSGEDAKSSRLELFTLSLLRPVTNWLHRLTASADHAQLFCIAPFSPPSE
jgi:hypothetical protein